MPESGDQGLGSKKAVETREMMCYLNALTDKDCEQLLESLHNYNPDAPKGPAGDSGTKFPQPMQSLDDYMFKMDTACNKEVQSQLYEEAKANEHNRKLILPINTAVEIPLINFNLDCLLQ